MNRCIGLLFLFFSFIISSCNSNEIGNIRDVNPERIYFDYRVSAEEGSEYVTVLLQYRFGGVNGTTLVLEDPSKVELDGERIVSDSSRMTGAFYEIMKPAKDFHGKHSILFTDITKKEYREEFNFQPMIMRTEPPAMVHRDDLVFEMDGLNPVDYVRILLTDTSFTSEGINRIDTVKNGRIFISKIDLQNLVNGPIQLEFYKENERSVKSRTEEGGKISVSYGLKREFQLTE